MINITKNIVIGLVLFFFLDISCVGQKKRKNEIKLNLNISDEFFIEEKGTQEIKMIINGNDIISKNIVNSTIKLTVINKNGTDYVINYQYLELDLNINSKYMNYEFSSQKEVDPKDTLAVLMKKILGFNFQVTLNEYGIISESIGIEPLLDTLINTFEMSLEKKVLIKNQLLEYYGAQTIKSMIDPIVNIYPKESVKISDTWNTEYESKNPIPIVYSNTFELKEVNNEEIVIIGNSNIKSRKEKVFANDKTYLLTGKQNFQLELDSKTKFIKTGEYKSTITGEVIYKWDNQTKTIPMELLTELSYTVKN